MDNQFHFFLESLYRSDRVESKFQHLASYIEWLGFEGVLYTFIPSIKGDHSPPDFIPVYMTSRNFSPQYLAHYASAEFSRVDPFIAAVTDGETENIDWWLRDKQQPYSENEREVILVAREEYQVKNGVTIPLHCSDVGIAGASLISSDTDPAFAILKRERLLRAEMACRVFHDHLSSNLKWHKPFLVPITSRMTPTQQKVLNFLLNGGVMKQLSTIEVSERYGYNLMRQLRRKFNLRNNEQLVSRLARIGVSGLLQDSLY